MKQPTMTEMQSVPAEFRAMTDAELNQVFDDNRRGLRTYKERDFARFEQHRRRTIQWDRNYVECRGPAEIAELESTIADIRKSIASTQKRIDKLTA